MRSGYSIFRRIGESFARWTGWFCVRGGLRSVGLMALLMVASPGCSTVMVSATNPVPGLTTVAVAPFFNLSAEPAADGRRVALAYFGELQKNPGFQVIPVGVVEQAINDNNLSMSSPADVVELARLLNVDAVVVGAITDYRPYYPPQIGLQVQWYSPRNWVFYPGIPSNPCPENVARGMSPNTLKSAVRGQSADDQEGLQRVPAPPSSSRFDPRIRKAQATGREKTDKVAANWPEETVRTGIPVPAPTRKHPVNAEVRRMFSPPGPAGNGGAPAEIKPLMTYTRMFHGLDPDLQSAIKAYVVYSADLRSGGWEAYLQRSDDFLKFTAHQMIVEMLALHGGTLKTESVLTWWK